MRERVANLDGVVHDLWESMEGELIVSLSVLTYESL